MQIRPLPAEESAVRRYVEELWIPYNRDLAAVVESHELAEDVDLVAEETEHRIDRLESDGYRAWVAVDGDSDCESDGEQPLVDVDGDLVGFVTTNVDEAPSVFEWPDRLIVGDFYVTEPHRGTGLARELLDRAAERARDVGCPDLELDVDVDNERALAFYEKVGFEPRRYRMRVAVDEL